MGLSLELQEPEPRDARVGPVAGQDCPRSAAGAGELLPFLPYLGLHGGFTQRSDSGVNGPEFCLTTQGAPEIQTS